MPVIEAFFSRLSNRERKNVWIEKGSESRMLSISTEPEFQVHAMTNYWPLGRCLIGHGKNARRYDDTIEIPKGNYQNRLQLI